MAPPHFTSSHDATLSTARGTQLPKKLKAHMEKMEMATVETPVTRTMTENTGRWSKEEHATFVDGLEKHGKEWKKIAAMIPSRTVVQIRTHAQKYFQKMAKTAEIKGEEVPPSMVSTASNPRNHGERRNSGSRRGQRKGLSISSSSGGHASNEPMTPTASNVASMNVSLATPPPIKYSGSEAKYTGEASSSVRRSVGGKRSADLKDGRGSKKVRLLTRPGRKNSVDSVFDDDLAPDSSSKGLTISTVLSNDATAALDKVNDEDIKWLMSGIMGNTAASTATTSSYGSPTGVHELYNGFGECSTDILPLSPTGCQEKSSSKRLLPGEMDMINNLVAVGEEATDPINTWIESETTDSLSGTDDMLSGDEVTGAEELEPQPELSDMGPLTKFVFA